MRIRLAFAAITVATLAFVTLAGCNPDAPARKAPLSVCQRAEMVPSYSVTYEDGSRVAEPSGLVQLAELSADDVPRSVACNAIVQQYEDDRTLPGFRF